MAGKAGIAHPNGHISNHTQPARSPEGSIFLVLQFHRSFALLFGRKFPTVTWIEAKNHGHSYCIKYDHFIHRDSRKKIVAESNGLESSLLKEVTQHWRYTHALFTTNKQSHTSKTNQSENQRIDIMPLPEARQVGTMMNPHLRVFDPHSGATNVFEVNKGSLRRKETVVEDMTERPRPPFSHTNVINTRSGRPKSPSSSSHQKTNYKPHESSQSLKSHASVSPFLFKTNPFPLHNSASRKLGIGSHSEWDLAKTQRDKSLPEVDPIQLGRTSPIRNFYGKLPISQHKPTIRFSSTGVPLFEVCTLSIIISFQL